MSLSPLPPAPEGVRYALTVPQSVLFADLSLRGSRKEQIRTVFGGDFELSYVVIDDGAMSWDFTGDLAFSREMFDTGDPAVAVRRFIAGMGATARAVEKTSSLVSSDTGRRVADPDDLLVDLRQYWGAYERHMTSLFTFWNVEELLSEALTESLRESGLGGEIESGLDRFLQPSETNYFALERRGLARIAGRFGQVEKSDPLRQAALAQHIEDFGFLLAPFNLGTPPSSASLEERMGEESLGWSAAEEDLIDGRSDLLGDLPESIRELGLLAQELTFWKTERLDVLALGDSRTGDLYRATADLLSIDLPHLFALRREEIEGSLRRKEVIVGEDEIERRLSGFCLVLDEDAIGFHEPSRQAGVVARKDEIEPEGVIRGTAASAGVATGRVRLIRDLDDVPSLQPGEVLVTTMTRPEMGVALDRAAAFVTDQGGRMAHAAIIAREMRKPCVIGTEKATQLLFDGLEVTVDGDNGLVTIGDESES